MSISQNHQLTAEDYDRLAREYHRTLPLEHFMESTPQSTQREIVSASLAVLKTRRPDMTYFNELLVQYWHAGQLKRVVPDSMIVLDCEVAPVRSSYAVELEGTLPFVAIEYVSSSSEGKDYEDSFRKYERELRVPACIMYYPERLDLRVHRLEGERYVPLEPDTTGRVEIPELELQIGLIDGWMRFWHRGELLELPGDLSRRVEEQERRLREQVQRIEKQEQRIDEQTQRLEVQTRQLATAAAERDAAKDQLSTVTDWLRSQVIDRATNAGRLDLVEQATTADAIQLQRWLGELP